MFWRRRRFRVRVVGFPDQWRHRSLPGRALHFWTVSNWRRRAAMVAAGAALGVLASPLKLVAAVLTVIGLALLLVWVVQAARAYVPEHTKGRGKCQQS